MMKAENLLLVKLVYFVKQLHNLYVCQYFVICPFIVAIILHFHEYEYYHILWNFSEKRKKYNLIVIFF